jgi:hypothetical protein
VGFERFLPKGLHRGGAVEHNGHRLPRLGPHPPRIGQQPGERRGCQELHPKRQRVVKPFDPKAFLARRPGMLQQEEGARPHTARLLLQEVDRNDRGNRGQREQAPRVGQEETHPRSPDAPISAILPDVDRRCRIIAISATGLSTMSMLTRSSDH